MSLQEPYYNSKFIDYELNQSFTRGRGETLEASQGNLAPGTHLGRKVTGAQSVSAPVARPMIGCPDLKLS